MAGKLAKRVVSAIRVGMQGKVKLIHIVLEVIVIFFSTLVFFPLSKNTQHFNQNCLLGSNMYVVRHNNQTMSLDLSKTVFGDLDDCNYTTFFSVIAALHGLIWIWFFFHLDSLRCHSGSTLNLMMPSMMTHILLLIGGIVSSVMIGSGFTSWCDRIENNNPQLRLSCKEYESLKWTENRSSFYTFNQLALVSSWIVVVFILVSVVMICVHLYWDFMATAYVDDKPHLEASGFADNGVSVVNKGAFDYSTDGFFSDSMGTSYNSEYVQSAEYKDDGAAAAAAAAADPPGDIVVNATVHTPDSVSQPQDSGLRNRGNAPIAQ